MRRFAVAIILGLTMLVNLTVRGAHCQTHILIARSYTVSPYGRT